MQNKLVVLHHELLYPAFLGAILFEFSRKIIGLEFDALSLFSALWFILYFSAAFLALSEAHEADSKIRNLAARKFGRWAFFANLVEIAIILAASLGTEVIESRGFHDQTHAIVYASWIGIPITAWVSNHTSERPVHVGLSVAAIAVGAIGLITALTSHSSAAQFVLSLMIMYYLLYAYYRIVFWNERWRRTYDPPITLREFFRLLITGKREGPAKPA